MRVGEEYYVLSHRTEYDRGLLEAVMQKYFILQLKYNTFHSFRSKDMICFERLNLSTVIALSTPKLWRFRGWNSLFP